MNEWIRSAAKLSNNSSSKGTAMRKLPLVAFFCVSLAIASGAGAQGTNWVYTVEDWHKSGPRADGKAGLQSMSVGTEVPEATPTGRAKFRDVAITVPFSDHVPLFMRSSLEGRLLKTMLIEGFPPGVTKPASRAPFAMRLSDIRVVSVHMSGSTGGTGESSIALTQVILRAAKVEIFTAHQTATGAMQPGQQFGWDIRAGKGL